MPRFRSGRRPPRKFKITPPPIPHGQLTTGRVRKPPRPTPAQLGVGSEDEVDCYLILLAHGIAPAIQVNFDGGSDVMGGERADFVLYDRRVIIEVVNYWHDLPEQQLKDARKWDKRRQEGWEVSTVDKRKPDFEGQVMEAAGQAVGA